MMVQRVEIKDLHTGRLPTITLPCGQVKFLGTSFSSLLRLCRDDCRRSWCPGFSEGIYGEIHETRTDRISGANPRNIAWEISVGIPEGISALNPEELKQE